MSTTQNTSDTPKTAADYEALAKGYQGQTEAQPKSEEQPNITKQVNELMEQVTVDDKGKYVYPTDTPEHLRLLVAGEKKFRDTQRGYTKAQQTTKELEAENRLLKEKLSDTIRMDIPKEDVDRLEELKFTDPDKWFEEMTAMKSKPVTKYDDIMSEVSQKAGKEFELGRRIDVLKDFNVGREKPITVEDLDNDVPPRLTNQLAKGDIDFEEYLSKVDSYLSKGRVIANETAPTDTNITNASGTASAGDGSSESIQNTNIALDYANMTL